MTDDKDELLQGLTSLGCSVEKSNGAIFVALPDDFAEFVLDRQEDWLYLGTSFLTPDEFDASEYCGQLDRFLLELQDRSLGCHFSYDRNGYLMIGAEVNLGVLRARDILHVMDQIAFIIEVCIPFCDRILQTGEVPSDAEIDKAFGANAKLH